MGNNSMSMPLFPFTYLFQASSINFSKHYPKTLQKVCVVLVRSMKDGYTLKCKYGNHKSTNLQVIPHVDRNFK